MRRADGFVTVSGGQVVEFWKYSARCRFGTICAKESGVMVDFARQTTTGFVRFYPISPAAKKYVEKRHWGYEKNYKQHENCTVFELPDEEGSAEHYGRCLVEAGFYVQRVEAR